MNSQRSVGTDAEQYTEVQPYLKASRDYSPATSSASEMYTAVRTVNT